MHCAYCLSMLGCVALCSHVILASPVPCVFPICSPWMCMRSMAWLSAHVTLRLASTCASPEHGNLTATLLRATCVAHRCHTCGCAGPFRICSIPCGVNLTLLPVTGKESRHWRHQHKPIVNRHARSASCRAVLQVLVDCFEGYESFVDEAGMRRTCMTPFIPYGKS